MADITGHTGPPDTPHGGDPDEAGAGADRPAVADAPDLSPLGGWPPRHPPPPAEPGPPPALGPWGVSVIGLLAALIGAVVGVSAVLLTADEPSASPPVTVIERVETRIVEVASTGVPTSPAEVARRVLPSIVTVEQGTLGDDGFVRTGGGSGVVIDEGGLLVTNHHVIEGAEAVRIVFASGRIVPATVVGSDMVTDLAVIAVDLEGLTPIEFGSTSSLSVGDAAFAVGNPLTLEGGPSVTSGVVSAFDRRVLLQGGRELFGMLQTDAPITRGSSGGALVDADGRLIGITTAIGVSDVGQEGLGFAVPVEVVEKVTAEIIATGFVTHAFLGISGTTHYADHPDGSSEPAGVEVVESIEGTAAEAAGILTGDIIDSYDGTRITTMEQLVLRLRLNRVGDVVRLGIVRGGESFTVDVELLERPEGV